MTSKVDGPGSAGPRVMDAPGFSVVGPVELARDDELRETLTALMTAHGSAVYGFCVRVLGDEVLAKDVLQQVFVEAYRDLDRFEHRSSVRSWLLGIANHRCLDTVKARSRRDRRFSTDEAAMHELPDPSPGAGAELDRTRLAAALEDCLAVLSTESRAAILLRFKAGMTYQDMATEMCAKPDTLQTRVARALPMLRRCLERRGWDGG